MNQQLRYLLEARFSETPPPGYKRREGPVFMLGDYPNKQFSLSAEEADAAIARFQPVQGDVEHMPTVLSGHLGILRRVWRDGQTLFGAADVPEWLDNILDGTKSGISLAWERAEKDIKGWGWTLDPAIKVAKLTTAFSNTLEGRATGNLVNTPAPAIAPSLTPRQRKEKRLMPIIDRLGKRIALFAAGAGSTTPEPTAAPEPAPAPTTPGPGIVLPTTTPAPAPQPTTTTTTTTPAPAGPGLPPTTFSAPGLDEPEMDDATASFKADQIANTAEREADALISAGHFYSAQRPLLLALFTAAGYDNEAHGASLVTFSRANGTVIQDRVEMLREVFGSGPTHSLFSAELPATILNGNRAPAEVQSAVQQGDEQAKKFNAEHFGQYLAQPATTNGNGNH